MYLASKGKTPSLGGLFELHKNTEPYLEAISPGLYKTIALGVFWVLLGVATHFLATPTSVTLHGRLETVAEIIGRRTFLLTGLCLIAIALPPPTITHLLLALVVLGAGGLIRYGLSAKPM